jgi:hypothetical protein
VIGAPSDAVEHERRVLTRVPFLAREEDGVPDRVDVADVVRYQLERQALQDVVDVDPMHDRTAGCRDEQVHLRDVLTRGVHHRVDQLLCGPDRDLG